MMYKDAYTTDTLTPAGHLPSVAVVILNWNGRHFLEKFMPSVTGSGYRNMQVVVADNASTDDSVDFLQKNYPAVEIIQNGFNHGFAKGYNEALKKVQADYFVLLNSDVEVTQGWIEPIIQLMERDKAIAACQPKILAYENKHLFEYAGASGGWIDNFGYPFMRGRIFDICETDSGQYDQATPCFWASGAALFIRSDVYRQLEGMDEYFFAHQEEIDLCWRAQLAGYTIYVQPASVVYHVGGGTLPKGNSRKTYLNFRNNLVMLYKNLPGTIACWKIPVRLWLDALAAWKGLFGGDSGFFLAVCRAHVDFVMWIFSRQKSAMPQKKTKVTLTGWYRGSIVWDYFFRNKKTFSEIIEGK